jgi:membrane-bound inhibitor of C-type lysozyme
MNTVFYKCNSIEIEMRYFPLHGVAVLVLDGKTHELQQQVSASGVWYSNAKYSFRAKGDDGWLEIGRMALMECKAISGLI